MLVDRRSVAVGSLAVVVAATLFGMLGPVSRLASERAGVDTIGFVTWRALFGALVVGAFVAVRVLRGTPIVGLRSLSGRARLSLLVAVVAGVLLNLAIFVAFGRITIALALLAFYTYPALVTAVVIGIERRRPDRFELVALAMAMAGMTIVVLGGIDPATGISVDPLGLGLALLAAASQTVFILVSRHGYSRLPTDEASFAVLGGGFLGFVIVAAIGGSLGSVTEPFGTAVAWPYLIVGGVLGAGIPTTLYLFGLRSIGGVRTGILALIEPVIGAALAAVVLGETLQPIQVVGGGLVLGAALLLQRSPAPAGAETPSDDPGDPPARMAAPLV
jgi:DME family drug/metabolite transporter